MSDKLIWWGYKHISGTLQAKRYFDKRDMEEAYSSDFVDEVVEPFEAEGRDEALEYIKNQTES